MRYIQPDYTPIHLKVENCIHNQEGFTASFIGQMVPMTGYIVGGVTPSLVLSNGYNETDLSEFINTYQGLLITPGYFLRGRSDEKTGRYYIDTSTIEQSKHKALISAFVRNEKAVWDIANNVEIRVGGLNELA